MRDYFYGEGLLEVVTSTLRDFGTNEVHLRNLRVENGGYLQTSPEYAMKCILATEHRSIFQICPAYRAQESGDRHRIEFQMLEWYRCDFTLTQLMNDFEAMLRYAANRLAGYVETTEQFLFSSFKDHGSPLDRVSYKSLFLETTSVNPHLASLPRLRELVAQRLPGLDVGHLNNESSDKADYLDVIFSEMIEPRLQSATIVYDFPKEQSALAALKMNGDGEAVSDRFEFYCHGLEIGNAYQELNDRAELERRFHANNRERNRRGLPTIEPDASLLEAMATMPTCAGIAIGLDRLAMAILGATTIDEVSLPH